MASPIQQRLEVEAKAFQQFQKGAYQNKDPAVICARGFLAGSISGGGIYDFQKGPNVLAGVVWGVLPGEEYERTRAAHERMHELAGISRTVEDAWACETLLGTLEHEVAVF
jgi:hypothetical protein